MIPLGYLEMLHANHEDWLHEQSVSAEELARHPMLHAEGACPPCKAHACKVKRARADAGLADCRSRTGHERSMAGCPRSAAPILLRLAVLKPASDEYVQQVLRSNPAVQVCHVLCALAMLRVCCPAALHSVLWTLLQALLFVAVTTCETTLCLPPLLWCVQTLTLDGRNPLPASPAGGGAAKPGLAAAHCARSARCDPGPGAWASRPRCVLTAALPAVLLSLPAWAPLLWLPLRWRPRCCHALHTIWVRQHPQHAPPHLALHTSLSTPHSQPSIGCRCCCCRDLRSCRNSRTGWRW